MKIEITLDLSHSLKHFLKELFMASVEDLLIENGKKLDSIITTLASSNNTAVMNALTGIQNSINAVIADIVPTPALIPTVTAISPANGSIAGGETITVTGTNFTGATGVMFGLVAGTNLVVQNDTSLTVISPAQPAATVDVQVVDSAGTSAANASDQYTLS